MMRSVARSQVRAALAKPTYDVSGDYLELIVQCVPRRRGDTPPRGGAMMLRTDSFFIFALWRLAVAHSGCALRAVVVVMSIDAAIRLRETPFWGVAHVAVSRR
jgi:hypothetical protein